MIFPEKHIRLSESLLGLGSFILEQLENGPRTVDKIWLDFRRIRDNDIYPAYHSFENFILAVDFLFSLGLLSLDDSGKLQK